MSSIVQGLQPLRLLLYGCIVQGLQPLRLLLYGCIVQGLHVNWDNWLSLNGCIFQGLQPLRLCWGLCNVFNGFSVLLGVVDVVCDI